MPAQMWNDFRSSQNPGLRARAWGSKGLAPHRDQGPVVRCPAQPSLPFGIVRERYFLSTLFYYFCFGIAKLVTRCLLLVNSLYLTVLRTDSGVPGA